MFLFTLFLKYLYDGFQLYVALYVLLVYCEAYRCIPDPSSLRSVEPCNSPIFFFYYRIIAPHTIAAARHATDNTENTSCS